MNAKLHLVRGSAILAAVASLAGTAAAVAPTAASAAGAKCANKSISIKPEEGPSIHIPVKAITVEGGVSCAEAYKVIAGGLEGKPVSGWKTAIGKFEAPEGLVPEIAKKGSKKIKFAVQGG
ncbi:MAG TPA: hypothetical protein VJ204_20450 [Solirubrobacterales bacterium]|nr:hypothetical protein [Solirubrobacterales bacterium]